MNSSSRPLEKDGAYYYRKGYNPAAIQAVIAAGLISVASVLVPRWIGSGLWISDYSWFIGCGVGFAVYKASFEVSCP